MVNRPIPVPAATAARYIHEAVHRAVIRDDLPDRRLDLPGVREIDGVGVGDTARIRDELPGFRQPIWIYVKRDNGRALSRKAQGGGAANAAGCARNQDYFLDQAAHT